MIARIRKTALLALGAVLATAAFGVAPAMAEFGMKSYDVTFTNEDGSPATQAGSHPFAMTTSFEVASYEIPLAERDSPVERFGPDGDIKDLFSEEVAGFAGDATAYPRCSTADYVEDNTNVAGIRPNCPDNTAVGVFGAYLFGPPPFVWGPAPVFNLVPAPGEVARLGFNIQNARVTLDVRVKSGGDYNVTVSSRGTSQYVPVFGGVLQLWGIPSDPAHDSIRGECLSKYVLASGAVNFAGDSVGECPVERIDKPFFTLPTNCEGPEATRYAANSWQNPGSYLPSGEPNLSDPAWASGEVFTHNAAIPPEPQGFTGCGLLPFKPSVTAEPTTKAADSPTGLDFSLHVHDEGLKNPEGLVQSAIKKVEVTLPEGMSANPSVAEGLGVCTEADLERETVDSEPGEGCPNASKIGTVEVESPEIEENVDGALYIAKPYENPFNSILAMYIVIKNPKLGIIVKQPLRVDRNPSTGQITTVGENLPQLPYSRFKLHFREGARSPLSSPPACGTYEAKAKMYPWSGTEPVETYGAFQIISGANGSPCPTGGLPAFHPYLEAGSINNAAGRFSPFYVRISRNDGEQEITHFSIKLPPGVTGKLAGIPFCSDAQIAAAKALEGVPHGGQIEAESPSCPAASEVGHTLVGAGVGPALTYAPGKVYLAGPYHGAPISVAAITSGIVGPFDIGTVVVREALKVNPETGEVFVDSTGSDPIPHIVEGFPVDLRDIRIYMSRPEFTLNPTNCTPTSTASTVLGSGLDFASEADDNPITVTSPFQAADCAQLPFEPNLTLRLKGKTNRGAHPALIARLRMHGFGEAGVAKAQVTLPHSEFIENAHFNTICTRVQFNAGAGNGEQCPKGSIYGHARAATPILSEPAEGNVYLRSNPERELPDVVAALHTTEINADLVGHVDSVKGGGIRTTFEGVPDVPVSWAVFRFAGNAKGLFVNSTNLCAKKHRATVHFDGQNGKRHYYRPVLKASCAKARKHRRHKAHRRSRAALRRMRAALR